MRFSVGLPVFGAAGSSYKVAGLTFRQIVQSRQRSIAQPPYSQHVQHRSQALKFKATPLSFANHT